MWTSFWAPTDRPHRELFLFDAFDTGIDRHSSWFRKEKDVKVDKTKKKPPQDINKLG